MELDFEQKGMLTESSDACHLLTSFLVFALLIDGYADENLSARTYCFAHTLTQKTLTSIERQVNILCH